MNHFIRLLGLCLLVVAPLSAQTTYTSSMLTVNTSGQAIFTFSTNGSQTLLVLRCGEDGNSPAQLITHSGQYGAQQAAGFEVPCSPRRSNGVYPFTYTQYLTSASPVSDGVPPPFTGEVTLNGEPVANTPNTITLTVHSANWSYHCLYRLGCPASGFASITITGSF